MFQRGGGRSHCVTPRVLTRLSCPHPRCVLLKVLNSERGGMNKPTNSCIDELSSRCILVRQGRGASWVAQDPPNYTPGSGTSFLSQSKSRAWSLKSKAKATPQKTHSIKSPLTQLEAAQIYLSELNVCRVSDARAVRLFITSVSNKLCIPNAEVFEGSFPLRKDRYCGPMIKGYNDKTS